MSKFTQKTNCTYCSCHNSVTVITKQSKWSITVQVMKCTECNKQNGIKETLNKKPDSFDV